MVRPAQLRRMLGSARVLPSATSRTGTAPAMRMQLIVAACLPTLCQKYSLNASPHTKKTTGRTGAIPKKDPSMNCKTLFAPIGCPKRKREPKKTKRHPVGPCPERVRAYLSDQTPPPTLRRWSADSLLAGRDKPTFPPPRRPPGRGESGLFPQHTGYQSIAPPTQGRRGHKLCPQNLVGSGQLSSQWL